MLTVPDVGPVTFGFVTFGDLPHLSVRHPIVFKYLGRNQHQPPVGIDWHRAQTSARTSQSISTWPKMARLLPFMVLGQMYCS